jgi:hypothetical protein
VRIEHTSYNAVPVDAAFAMTVDPRFQELKCADAGALSWDVQVEHDGERVVVRTKRTMPTVGFPSVLRRFVPSGMTARETTTWSAPAEDGSRSGDLELDFHGAPVSMSGTVRLAPDGPQASTVVVRADFVANVPVVGSRIEKFAVPIIVSVIEAEEKTSRRRPALSAGRSAVGDEFGDPSDALGDVVVAQGVGEPQVARGAERLARDRGDLDLVQDQRG